MQLLFLIFTVATGLFLFPFTYYGYYVCANNYNNAPKDYRYPVIYDLKDVLWVSVIILMLLWIVGKLSYHLWVPCSKGKGDPLEVEMRCTKAGNTLAKCFYMCVSTSFGIYVMKDAYFYPVYLGGKGDYSLLFKEYPY